MRKKTFIALFLSKKENLPGILTYIFNYFWIFFLCLNEFIKFRFMKILILIIPICSYMLIVNFNIF